MRRSLVALPSRAGRERRRARAAVGDVTLATACPTWNVADRASASWDALASAGTRRLQPGSRSSRRGAFACAALFCAVMAAAEELLRCFEIVSPGGRRPPGGRSASKSPIRCPVGPSQPTRPRPGESRIFGLPRRRAWQRRAPAARGRARDPPGSRPRLAEAGRLPSVEPPSATGRIYRPRSPPRSARTPPRLLSFASISYSAPPVNLCPLIRLSFLCPSSSKNARFAER